MLERLRLLRTPSVGWVRVGWGEDLDGPILFYDSFVLHMCTPVCMNVGSSCHSVHGGQRTTLVSVPCFHCCLRRVVCTPLHLPGTWWARAHKDSPVSSLGMLSIIFFFNVDSRNLNSPAPPPRYPLGLGPQICVCVSLREMCVWCLCIGSCTWRSEDNLGCWSSCDFALFETGAKLSSSPATPTTAGWHMPQCLCVYLCVCIGSGIEHGSSCLQRVFLSEPSFQL